MMANPQLMAVMFFWINKIASWRKRKFRKLQKSFGNTFVLKGPKVITKLSPPIRAAEERREIAERKL